jgi:hypothetical protein
MHKRIVVKSEPTSFAGKPTKGLRVYPEADALPKKGKLSDDSENPADFDDPLDV